MSEDDFTFNAPQYYDFNGAGEEHSDEDSSFFEKSHEETEENDASVNEFYKSCTGTPGFGLTRSSSVGCRLNIIPPSNKNTKKFGSTGNVCLLKEHINRLAEPKHKHEKHPSEEKFMTMSEQIRKFQTATPQRYHTTKQPCSKQLTNVRPKLTVAQSPALSTKARSRPVVKEMTREEKELAEFKEEQKFKIKAHPVNKKILYGPLKATASVMKKHATIPEPFKLTEKPKKVIEVPKVPEFHARPVPKTIFKSPKLKLPDPVPTEPITPQFMKRYSKKCKDEPDFKKDNKENVEIPLSKTVPKPFSFEKRDMLIQKKKEELVAKAIEEEKKAREFHARPVPKTILRSKNSSNNSLASESNTSTKSFHKSEETLAPKTFKARPATVLLKAPFQPKLDNTLVTQFADIQLSTERRALERKNYEERLKEREKEREYLFREAEEQKMRREQEEIAEIRKQAIVTAQPIRKYKPVIIMPSNKVTNPKSPNFLLDLKKNVN